MRDRMILSMVSVMDIKQDKIFHFMSTKKNIIMIFITILLFSGLTTLKCGANYMLSYKTAGVVCLWFIFGSMILRYLEYSENKALEKRFIFQHKQMSAIINNAPFMIFLKDLKGNVIMSNAHYFGFDNEHTAKFKIGDISDDIISSEKEDNEVIKNKRSVLVERHVKTINGWSGWWKIMKIPIFDDTKNVSNIMVIAIDIDKEKHLQEQKMTFVATLTHDLKTPLSAQINALNLLLKNSFGELNNEQYDIISQIKESCEYTKNLAHAILDTYLYENGQMKLAPEKFKWNSLVDEVVSETSRLAKDKSQKIIIDSSVKNNEIVADKFQLKRVIVNLISNAIQYGFNNTKIEVTSEQDEKNLIFNVKSFSKYIKQDNIKRVYDKFRTDSITKNSTSYGLGLYLVKQIITAHKGYVFAKSEKNGECSFGFVIPQK